MTDEEVIRSVRDHLHKNSVERSDNGMFAELKEIDRDAWQALWYIAQEIVRQREDEGWSIKHDDEHADGQMAVAAACYAHLAGQQSHSDFRARSPGPGATAPSLSVPPAWPWDERWWKPKNVNRNLIRAGALIAVEWGRWQRWIVTRVDRPKQAGGTDGI